MGGLSDVEKTKIPEIWRLSTVGRYGRLNFINANIIISLAIAGAVVVFSFIADNNRWQQISVFIVLGVLVCLTWCVTMAFMVRAFILRLHDMNRSGYLALAYVAIAVLAIASNIKNTYDYYYSNMLFVDNRFSTALAVIQLAILIIMCVIPGTRGSNRYGNPAMRGSFAGLTAISIAVVVCAALVLHLM